MDYSGMVTLDTEYAFLNRPRDNLIFDKKEMDKLEYDLDIEEPLKKNELSYYEDYGWRTQCKFVVHEASKFRFMRLVSGQDEAYPFVIYDLGWKVV